MPELMQILFRRLNIRFPKRLLSLECQYLEVLRFLHVTEEEIHEYISKRMAPYKQLRGGIVYVDELPKMHMANSLEES